jgi:Tfp pilus assembly protein PilV
MIKNLLVTMRIYFPTVLRGRRRSRRRDPASVPGVREHGRRRRAPDARSEDGFLLIEVLVSTLLVGMIVIATFNGFDAATRASGDQRRHNEAALLAAQSQEQLRSDPATALDALESTPHSYTKEVEGTVYTITQEAKAVSASGSATGCTATSKSSENGANIQISSSVTWSALVAAKRPSVKQASVITPPVGSALEVDVTNEAAPPEGQSGVTAVAKFLPSGSATYTSAEGTTGPAGCVVLTGLATTMATVEIAEKLYFVTTSGKLHYPSKEVTIAPNVTTQYPVAYAEGGRITATFTYKGEETWEGQKVKGDTFVASNTHIPSGNVNYQVGSTGFEYKGAEEQYKALTSAYSQKASTAAATKYLHGDLFPFAAPWTLYAGDCPANDVGKEAESSEEAVIEEGGTIVRTVPTSYTKTTAWTGPDNKSAAIRGEAEKERLGPVKITNSECASSEMPDNSYEHIYTHEQTETLPEGRLENPFQPFGTFSLCLVDKKTEKTYTVKYVNAKVEGSTPQIYLGQKTATQQLEQRTAELAAKTKLEKEETEAIAAKEKRAKEEAEVKTAKEKREKEEAEAKTAKEKRVKEEAEAKTARENREAEEKKEREKWVKEEGEGKLKPAPATRKGKETTQTNTRLADEAAEKLAREKREKEETEATTAKEKRVKEEAEVGPAKEKRAAEEAAAKAPKEARENALKEATAKEEVRKKEEEAEAATGVLVEKKASC